MLSDLKRNDPEAYAQFQASSKQLKKAFDEMDSTIESEFCNDYNLPGWSYKDVPKITEDNWQQFLNIMGEGNYKVLVESMIPGHVPPLHIGQLMISPDGVENLKRFIDK